MKKEIEIEKLKLAYQRQLYYLNAVLLLGTVGILSFISTFIWKREIITIGFILLVIIMIIAYKWHNKIDKTLREILGKIEKI